MSLCNLSSEFITFFKQQRFDMNEQYLEWLSDSEHNLTKYKINQYYESIDYVVSSSEMTIHVEYKEITGVNVFLHKENQQNEKIKFGYLKFFQQILFDLYDLMKTWEQNNVNRNVCEFYKTIVLVNVHVMSHKDSKLENELRCYYKIIDIIPTK